MGDEAFRRAVYDWVPVALATLSVAVSLLRDWVRSRKER